MMTSMMTLVVVVVVVVVVVTVTDDDDDSYGQNGIVLVLVLGATHASAEYSRIRNRGGIAEGTHARVSNASRNPSSATQTDFLGASSP
jgi:hypothetical protein